MSDTRTVPQNGSGPLIQAARLLVFSILLASALWALRPDALSWQADSTTYELELSAPLVDLQEALRLFEEGDTLYIDTRKDAAEVQETIAGSLLIREKSFDDDLVALMDDFYPEDPVILFGDGDLSGTNNVAARLLQRGYEDLLILEVGVGAWQKSGGEMSPPYIPEAFDDADLSEEDGS